jgi:hypothetical protein
LIRNECWSLSQVPCLNKELFKQWVSLQNLRLMCQGLPQGVTHESTKHPLILNKDRIKISEELLVRNGCYGLSHVLCPA